jgi:hypothetical protein
MRVDCDRDGFDIPNLHGGRLSEIHFRDGRLAVVVRFGPIPTTVQHYPGEERFSGRISLEFSKCVYIRIESEGMGSSEDSMYVDGLYQFDDFGEIDNDEILRHSIGEIPTSARALHRPWTTISCFTPLTGTVILIIHSEILVREIAPDG